MSAVVSLKQMAEDKTNPAVSKRTIFQIDPMIVEFEPGFNVRIDTAKFRAGVERLKRSLIAGAVFPPIDVRVVDGRVLVVDGHRRTLAYHAAIAEGHEFQKMEARTFDGNDADRVNHMLDTGEGSSPISTIEKGIGYKNLLRMGWTKKEICARRDVSLTHVEQALTLANANTDVRMLVAEELVSASVALDAIREHGEKAGTYLKTLVENAPEVIQEGQSEPVKKKVTKRIAKTVSGDKPSAARALPRKLTDRYVSTVGGLFATMPREMHQRIATADDDAMIPVSAVYLKELLNAHAEVERMKAPEQPATVDERQQSLLNAA